MDLLNHWTESTTSVTAGLELEKEEDLNGNDSVPDAESNTDQTVDNSASLSTVLARDELTEDGEVSGKVGSKRVWSENDLVKLEVFFLECKSDGGKIREQLLIRAAGELETDKKVCTRKHQNYFLRL